MSEEQLQIGVVYSISAIKKIKGSSYIPSDYCYNSYCINSQWDQQRKFLYEKIGRGEYKYLGIDYPYSGKVFDKNNNLYGYWENGKFTKKTENKVQKDKFTWVPFFEELLDKICKDFNKEKLYDVWHEFFPDKYTMIDIDADIPLTKIDPLSFVGKVISLGNSELTNKCELLKNKFNLDSDIPKDYCGIPRLNRTNCIFFKEYWENRKSKDDLEYLDYIIDTLWDFAKDLNQKNENHVDYDFKNIETILSFNWVGLSKLSQLIFLFKPNLYFACDDRMVSFLFSEINDRKSINDFIKIQELAKKYDKKPYEISYDAYLYSEARKKFFDYIKERENKFASYASFLKTQLYKEQFERFIYNLTKKKLFEVETDNDLNILLNELKNNDKWNTYNDGYGNGIPYAILNKHYRNFINGVNVISNDENEDKEPMEELNIPKNQILYGPPGTGKTYNTVIKAMEIINKDCIEYDNEGDVRNYDVVKKEFDKLKESGQIEFVTFHQSYSYEEFVEGIKPKLNSNDLGYIREDGIFKNICNTSKEIKEIKSEQIYDFDNLSVYKILIPDPNLFEYCIANDCVAIGWGEDIDISNCTSVQEISNKIPENYEHKNQCISQLNLFKNWIDRDLKEGREVIIVIPNSMTSIKGIAKVTGEYYFNDEIENGSQRRPVEWLRTNVNIDSENIYSAKFVPPTITGMYPEKINKESFLNLINNQNKKDNKNCVLIIDEINRGDVSKIFGELITLIEEDKRLGAKYAMTTTLPYSKKSFGVPSNLFIIGTMNTADRSIALLDTALRRRFDFEEMMPRPELLKNREVKDINLQTLLTRINERIEKEYDRDHQIGHSYLMGVNDEKDLERAYKNRILPLLNEYFYNDAESVAKILNCKVEELKDDFLKVLKNAQSNDNNKQ